MRVPGPVDRGTTKMWRFRCGHRARAYLRGVRGRPVTHLLLFLHWLLIGCSGPADADSGVALDGGSDAGLDAAPADAGPVDAGVLRLQLLGITDFHGRVMRTVDAPGASLLATEIARLRAEVPNTLLVSSGDLIGASTLHSAALRDEPTIDLMDVIGLDVGTVGNHELDRPFAELRRLLEGGCHPGDGCFDPARPYDGASFPVLGANVLDATGEPVLPPTALLEVGGIRVGFIGVTLVETADLVYPPYLDGLSFADEADTVNRYVPELRTAGADVVVVLMHHGVESPGLGCLTPRGGAWDDVERFDPGVIVVFMGHTHAHYACSTGGPAFVAAGSWGQFVADVDLTLDARTREILATEVAAVRVTAVSSTQPDVDAYVAWLEGVVGPIAAREVGRITADVSNAVDANGSQAAGYLVADAILAAFPDADVAFHNHGGTRSTLRHAADAGEPEDGIVTYRELFDMLPFGNDTVVMTLTGAQLETLLEQQFRGDGNNILQPSSTLRYRWTVTTLGDHVDPADVLVDGAPLDLAGTYRVAANGYIGEGGAEFHELALGTGRVAGPPLLDVVEAYLAAASPYTPPPLDRISGP